MNVPTALFYSYLSCKNTIKVSTAKRYWHIQLTVFLFASINIGDIYTGLAFILKRSVIFYKEISYNMGRKYNKTNQKRYFSRIGYAIRAS